MNSDLIKKLAVTYEAIGGREISEAAAKITIGLLDQYPEEGVSLALDRCLQEVKGHLAPSDIIQRIDDGRPGAEEAWGMLPKGEAETVVWTDEMSSASISTIGDDDKVAARMTFKETYARLVREARDRREPANWQVSLGHDKEGRYPAIRAALEAGRISYATAEAILSPVEYRQFNPGQCMPELPERNPKYGGWQLCAKCNRPLKNGRECNCGDPSTVKTMLAGFRESHGIPEDWKEGEK